MPVAAAVKTNAPVPQNAARRFGTLKQDRELESCSGLKLSLLQPAQKGKEAVEERTRNRSLRGNGEDVAHRARKGNRMEA